MTRSDVASILELTDNQTDVLVEVLSVLSLCNGKGAGGSSCPVAPGSESIYCHELSMFLLAQLFSREAQRPDVVEYWPEGQATAVAFNPGMDTALMSPTRQFATKASAGEFWRGAASERGSE